MPARLHIAIMACSKRRREKTWHLVWFLFIFCRSKAERSEQSLVMVFKNLKNMARHKSSMNISSHRIAASYFWNRFHSAAKFISHANHCTSLNYYILYCFTKERVEIFFFSALTIVAVKNRNHKKWLTDVYPKYKVYMKSNSREWRRSRKNYDLRYSSCHSRRLHLCNCVYFGLRAAVITLRIEPYLIGFYFWLLMACTPSLIKCSFRSCLILLSLSN